MTYFEAFILSMVEGLTEFIPVSSTGHLVLVSEFLKITDTPFTKCFDIIIQLAAILAVVVLFWRSFFPLRRQFYEKLMIATIPASVAGFLLKKKIDDWLGSPHLVAAALLLGGIFLLILDQWEKKNRLRKTPNQNHVSLRQAGWMGIWQCLALVPGTSRSAATIGSGILLGLSRQRAAEFSFLMAVPVMCGASIIKFKTLFQTDLTLHDWSILGFSCICTFIISLLVLKLFLSFLRTWGFAIFGWYRIGVAILIFTLIR